MTRFDDVTDVLNDLREPAPKNRRKTALCEKLNQMVPSWRDLVRTPEFAYWTAMIDSVNGTCMLDRIRILLQDPVFAAADLAIIFRMFDRQNTAHSIATGFRHLFRCTTQPQLPKMNPVLSGKYELIKPLGRGGNGEVYLAWSTETDKFYALKTIRPDFTKDPAVRQLFRNEAEAWISIEEHPNVAKVYFFEEIGPQLYITMEYVEEEDDGIGPSLADKLASGRVRTENLCAWFCQIADGLSHAYKNGIKAHRDIKPGNILIDRDGVAQISDFGLAATVSTLFPGGNQNHVVGTPLFMSPEQFLGQHECDQRSDIYSLGVTLYQAVSGGTLPFMPQYSTRSPADLAGFLAEIRNLHETATPQPMQSFLWPVIAKCLMKNPMDRFPDIEAFRDTLTRLAEKHQISVPKLAEETTDFWALRDQGNTFMRLSKYEDAIKAFDAFIAVMPDENAVFNRAVCLENLERYEEALQIYESFAKRGDIKGIVNLGNCLRALGRKQEALNYAKRAVALEQDDVSCWITLGNAYFAIENWREAIKAYTTAHQLEPSDPTPIYNLGLTALRAGHVVQAKKAFLAFMHSSMLDDNRRQYVEGMLQRLGEGDRSD